MKHLSGSPKKGAAITNAAPSSSKTLHSGLSSSASSNGVEEQPMAPMQRHRALKRPPGGKDHRSPGATNNGTNLQKLHKHKKVRLIKRKKKPSGVVVPVARNTVHAQPTPPKVSPLIIPPNAPKLIAPGSSLQPVAPASRAPARVPSAAAPPAPLGSMELNAKPQRPEPAMDVKSVAFLPPPVAPATPVEPVPIIPPPLPIDSHTGASSNENPPPSLDATNQPQSLSVSRNVLLSQPNSRIVNRADSSGLMTTSKATSELKPPPISKEVIEWLARERVTKSQANMELQNEIQSQRLELMLQRQISAARQMRIQNRAEGMLLRETIGDDLSERLLESEWRRHDDLRKQLRGRDRLRSRVDQLQHAFAGWR